MAEKPKTSSRSSPKRRRLEKNPRASRTLQRRQDGAEIATAQASEARDGRRNRRAAHLVVGIGASAGGLAAFQQFLSAMPAKSGMTFVLIQHLDPTHASLTAELLGGHTAMRVVQVERATPVEADHVYVIPPNRYLSIGGDVLRLSVPRERRGLRMPIDLFLRSLAEDQQERAVAVILSGTGSDGAHGLKEVKAAGGMTVVQAPNTAQHDGMPRSAIATEAVDHVVPADKIPALLLRYVRHPYVKQSVAKGASDENAPDDLHSILAILRTTTRFDFGGYMPGTLARRIRRRMGLRHVEHMADYVRVLRRDDAEVQALFQDLLISVTSFFREPAAWEVLEKQVVPRLLGEESQGPVRVWVPGCATGEEAYSIAILLAEGLEAAKEGRDLQIFATDVDAKALERARVGAYPENIVANVSAARLRRFFVHGQGEYQVRKELRESIVFGVQNLISDSPFSRLNLISCRNLLIYLDARTQERLISLFHFALADPGFLFLGSAEGIGRHKDLFQPVAKRWRIYGRTGPARHDRLHFPALQLPQLRLATDSASSRGPAASRGGLAGLVQQLLLRRYTPACVVINRRHEILYLSGPTDEYLVHPQGLPTQDLIANAREGLGSKLRAAVSRAIREDQPVTVGGVRVKRGKRLHPITLTVEPLKTALEGLLFVAFEDETTPAAGDDGETLATPPAEAPATPSAEESLVGQLEYELKTTKEDYQGTIEELEISNEELKAANEEVLSANEELQSTNEELETSKEELQSLNEELSTLTSQLQDKVVQLESANNDLDNLLTSTNVATVFLDLRFHIRRFTPSATRLFKLIPTDVGRPLGDIVQRFTDPNLLRDAKAVRENLIPIRQETHGDDGVWYMREVLPYRTQDDRIEGVVITFSDVAAQTVQEARVYAESIVGTVREPLLVLDTDLRVCSANASFSRTFGVAGESAVGTLVYELGGRQWDIPELRQLLEAVLRERKPFEDFEVDHDFEQIGRRTMLINARPLILSDGRPRLILMALEDVSERKRSAEAIERMVRELDHRVKNTLAVVESVADHTVRSSATMEEFRDSFGRRIRALGQMHRALAESDWSDVELRRLIEMLASPFRRDSVRVEGVSFRLPPSWVRPLGLALHELLTDAAKFGALSTPEGQVSVSWRVHPAPRGAQLRIEWVEHGGPPVAPPTRRGFGHTVIEEGIPYELGGQVNLDFPAAGLRCEMAIPLPSRESDA